MGGAALSAPAATAPSPATIAAAAIAPAPATAAPSPALTPAETPAEITKTQRRRPANTPTSGATPATPATPAPRPPLATVQSVSLRLGKQNAREQQALRTQIQSVQRAAGESITAVEVSWP